MIHPWLKLCDKCGKFIGKKKHICRDNTKNKGLFKKGEHRSPKTEFKKGQPAPKAAFKKGHITWNKGKKGLQGSGKTHASWKGGKTTDSNGYILIYMPEHPFVMKRAYVFEHRIILEQILNRHLTSKEVVHHINGIKNDNRPENLKLFANNSEHRKFHYLLKKNKISATIQSPP